MKDGTDRKLKFKQLQSALELSWWQARGLLDGLWDFVKNNCPRGDVGRFTDEEIAVGIDWRGDAQVLIQALILTRWLDEVTPKNAQERPQAFSGVTMPQCRFVVHDWSEHCEDSVHKALIKNVETFADGTFPSLARVEKSKRPQIVKQYELKYGKDAWKNGKTPENAYERQKTPENAPTYPSQAYPSQAYPPPPPANGDRQAAAVEDVLIELGCEAGAAHDAVAKARVVSVTDAQILAIADFWTSHPGWGPGALVRRVANATPRSPPDKGWPEALRDKSAPPTPHQTAEDRFYAAQQLIDRCRREKKTDAEIEQVLQRHGFDLQEAFADKPKL